MFDFSTGWLSPDGSFVQCGTYEHLAIAKSLVDKYYPNDPNTHNDDILYNNGWVHITISQLDHAYRIGWSKYLTEYQKQFLKRYFESDIIVISKFDIIKWRLENGEDYQDICMGDK